MLERYWGFASRVNVGIRPIDEDQGRSGTSAVHRPGFKKLVAEISAGQVGIVLALEASRLARSSADWHRLVEICSITRTLLADDGAVYDPREPNDRLWFCRNSHLRSFGVCSLAMINGET